MTKIFENNDLTPCYWLTIGVGGDTEVEKEMKIVYPKCKIFGIEPSPDQYKDFDKYGTIIPHAIGIKAGNFTMRLLKKNGYVDVLVPVTPLHQVLDEFIGSRLIHFSTLDIEGFEYSILESLKYGKPIESMGVRFCQIDAELHSLEHQAKRHIGNNFDFQKYWNEFLNNSPYIPVKASDFLAHRKITLINVDDVVCQRSFNFQQFF
uniref:Methyltransferase FkbM domain-containing protein n=1 Tax=Plectus sambesii TaxID=2011161 RepID=A0A914W7N9_9BILA